MTVLNKRFLALAIMTTISLGTGTAMASEMTDSDSDLLSYNLDEVVVTATRMEKRDIDVPAATSIITAEDILASGAKSAAEALEQANGFAYKSFGPDGSSMGTMTNELNLRGVKGGVLVLVNGNPISWRGKYNLDAIAASSIERIEIVKGGGSVLYGSEAVSGVVNIITKKTLDSAVYGGFGNFGQRRFGVSVGDDQFGLFYNYSKWGRRDNLTTAVSNLTHFKGATTTDLRDVDKKNAGFTYRLNEKLDFLFNYYETESTYNRRITKVNSSTDGLQINEQFNSRKYITERYTTQFNYNDNVWKGSLYFNTGTTEGIGPVFISSTGRRVSSWYHAREKNTSYGLDAQRTWNIGDKSTVIAGIHFENEKYTSIPTFTNPKREHHSRNNWGVFAQLEQRFDERNTGIFGLRETWTSGADMGQNYNNLSASAQWLHKLDDTNSLYLNVNQSFVMPTFAEMYRDNGVVLAAPNLKPQKGINYEIGWKHNQGAHSWKAALFHIRVDDKITAKFNSTKTQFQYTNEEFKNTGIEISDSIKGKNGFSYDWGIIWQNPESYSPDKGVGWERTFGKLQLTGGITYKKDKWTSSLSGSYLAGRVQTPSSQPAFRSKPYFLTSWNTTYTINENSSVSLRIDNVLNRDDSTSHSGSDYYVAPISYFLSYNYTF